MPSTEFACLHKVKKELKLLQKLYTLYDAVMVSINGYYDVLWAELDIVKINTELLDFQARYVDLFYYVLVRAFCLAACLVLSCVIIGRSLYRAVRQCHNDRTGGGAFRMGGGVHDSYIFPVRTGGIFYFPWHRHQVEGTDSL